MSAAQGGLIRGTDEGDVINVTATTQCAIEVDLRDNDNQTDNFICTAIAAAVGPTLVKIYGLTVLHQNANADRLNSDGFVPAMLFLPPSASNSG